MSVRTHAADPSGGRAPAREAGAPPPGRTGAGTDR